MINQNKGEINLLSRINCMHFLLRLSTAPISQNQILLVSSNTANQQIHHEVSKILTVWNIQLESGSELEIQNIFLLQLLLVFLK